MNLDSYTKLLQHNDLYPAELALLNSLKQNQRCSLVKTEENKIRGSILERLIRTAHEKRSIIPDKGLIIEGAFIVGDIDLCGCTISKPIEFLYCKILGVLDFSKSKITELVLKGTSVEKLNLENINCSGNIILSKGFKTLHYVNARGAKIDGQLGCSGGEFRGYPIAITLESVIVKEAFFWRQIKGLWGKVDLTNATVGLLVDDPDSWPIKGDLRLAGFSYEALGSNTTPSYYNRLDWLNRQYAPHLAEDFRPQPFEQLVKVLKASGRHEVAKNISIAKLNKQRNANFLRRKPKLVDYIHQHSNTNNIIQKIIVEMVIEKEKKISIRNLFVDMRALLNWLKSYIFEKLAGYGYKPFRIILWSFFIILIGTFAFSNHYMSGHIVESNAENKGSFNSFVFALDTFVPLVNLREAGSWKLISNEGQSFHPLQVFYWSYIFIGWIFTAIFAASITGIIKK